MATAFDDITAIERVGDGEYRCSIDRAGWVIAGPNGGYLGAILVRALEDAIGEPARRLRSITIHYLRPPAEGTANVAVAIERHGRTLTTATVRLAQAGKLQVLAIAAFASGRASPTMHHAAMAEVPPPSRCERRPSFIPLHELFDCRVAVGPTGPESPRAREGVSGGWIRLIEPRPIDAALLVAIADAWPPALLAAEGIPAPVGGVPTIDLTVHVRGLDTPPPPPDTHLLALFRTRELRDGFLEEDGEIWTPGGDLLAHSRQLGLFR